MALNIVFSFDTTGSMSGCIGQVRSKIEKIINDLFEKVPDISIGLVAHGDYCDKDKLMTSIDLTNDKNKLIQFVKNAPNTSGGDFPEAYEYVLREVQNFSWNTSAVRTLVMIGDATPHEKNDNPYKIDWRTELVSLKELGISIYSVQCLNSGSASTRLFYKQMSSVTGGYHLYLDQFQHITEMMYAICYKHMGTLENYKQELTETVGLSENMRKMFDVMLGHSSTEEIEKEEESRYDWRSSRRTTSSASSSDRTVHLGIDAETAELKPVPPSRFQVIPVESDSVIKQFTIDNGLTFRTGKGFYQFVKPELIQKDKEIILRKKSDGTFYEGTKARVLLGLVDYDPSKKKKCTDFPEYDVFIQSTSYNRKLNGGTMFLYDTFDDSE
jgi:hypothetical protein